MRNFVLCLVAIVALSTAAQADTLYALDFSGNLYTVNEATAAATWIGNTGSSAQFGLADRGNDLWTYDQIGDRLQRLNTATGGVLQNVGGVDFGVGEGSIAFNGAGVGYATRSSGGVGALYRFDTLGNVALVDGNLTPSMDGLDFAITGTGRLHGKAQVSGDHYIIDTTNGDTTLNRAGTADGDALSGLTFRHSDNSGWYEAGGHLYREATDIGAISGLRGALSGLSWMADEQAPEPVSLALLGVAGVFIVRRRRKA